MMHANPPFPKETMGIDILVEERVEQLAREYHAASSDTDMVVLPFCFEGGDPATHDRRKRFVSLWDMLKFDGRLVFSAVSFLAAALSDWRALARMASSGHEVWTRRPLEDHAMILKSVERLRDFAADAGLPDVERQAQVTLDQLIEELARRLNGYDNRNLQGLIAPTDRLLHSFISATERKRFYVLEGDERRSSLLGLQARLAFEASWHDCTEAELCLSLDRWTACVMHLMRVLEIGLQALAHHCEVEHGGNWNRTLNDIEAKLRTVRKTTDGAEAEEWAAEAGTHLRFIKNAWRNPAMHSGGIYTKAEAEHIFEATGSFMNHLAEKISQEGRRGGLKFEPR